MKEQGNPKKLNVTQIKEIIPHRYPMLLVDQVLDYEPGQYVIAKKNTTVNEAYFQGHFPSNPVMPGVLIVEALAQTGAIALLTLPEFRGKTAYFGGIKRARFRKIVNPGSTLRLEVMLDKIQGYAGVGKAKAIVNSEVVCTCEIIFVIK